MTGLELMLALSLARSQPFASATNDTRQAIEHAADVLAFVVQRRRDVANDVAEANEIRSQ